MGLIQAAMGAASGVLADQFKEYFYCEALPVNVLAVKGHKRVTGRSGNRGSDNIITNGSVIAVADGQCMLIVEQGKIVDICAEPGEYVYDASTEPSVFDGGLSEGIKTVFAQIGKRFTFGGDAPKDQRIYYFNTRELVDNKYGTPSPVPFRVVDERAGIDIDISLRCFGEYSYRIVNPLLFYTNVCGNLSEIYTRDKLEGQMKAEMLTALQPAFARISEMGIRYSAIPGRTIELASALNDVLSAKWRDLRGIEIVSFGVSSVKASEEDEAMLKQMQKAASLRDPELAMANYMTAKAAAIQDAAKNPNGAGVGFMNVSFADNAGSGDMQTLAQMSAQKAAAGAWKCPKCGASVTGNFCPECGTKKPEVKAGGWVCPKCGAQASGNFCPECGTKKPAEDGWVCPECGTVNKGKFCAECGTKKPDGVPQYRCDKCGWEVEKGAQPPKFCPECGDPFDDGDIVG